MVYIYFSVLNVFISDEIFFLLILRVILLVLQINSSHSTLRVKYEKQILPSVGFEPTTSSIRGKRLTARPRGPHGRKRTTVLYRLQVLYKCITTLQTRKLEYVIRSLY